MSLFQKSVINKYNADLDKGKVQDAYTKFKAYFHNPTIQENIINAKEEQFQEGFLTELFCKILGYTINPNPNFNLTTEIYTHLDRTFLRENILDHHPLYKVVKTEPNTL